MTDVVFSSVTFSPSDFSNYGWIDPITVNGASYIRILGLFAAAMADLSRNMVTTATASSPTPLNFATVTAGDTVVVALAQCITYQSGQYVMIVDTSNPTTRQVIIQVTTTITTGTTLTGTVVWVLNGASGTATALTVSLTSKQGTKTFVAAGAPGAGVGTIGDAYINSSNGDFYIKTASGWGAALFNFGTYAVAWYSTSSNKTADFTAVTLGNYTVDTTAGTINATLPASATIGDKIRIAKYGTGLLNLLANGLKINGATGTTAWGVGEGTFELTYSGASRGWV